MPQFCALPDEATDWIQLVQQARSLTLHQDPTIEYRRWLSDADRALPPDAFRSAGARGLVMIDLPRRTPDALLIGDLRFKGHADYPEEAERGRRLAGILRRDLRRLCTEPLYARSLRESGTASPRPSMWSTPRAIIEQRRGLPIRQAGVAFIEFVPAIDP